MSTKIEAHHLSRPSYIYIRQSTRAQVLHHQESTDRQYALQDKAVALGWPLERTLILDGDLAQSGAQIHGRKDFKRLLADVSLGQVGAVFALEASRLARSDLQWHRLLEICALSQTLVIDEDGCYDPADFNDALLLGLKATIAQAELHFMRERLQGGASGTRPPGESYGSPCPPGCATMIRDMPFWTRIRKCKVRSVLFLTPSARPAPPMGWSSNFASKGCGFPNEPMEGPGTEIWSGNP